MSNRILLIDDNRQGLAARRILLQELGYDVATAEGGEQGLRRFAESGKDGPFSLVVTDFRMPEMQGDEVIRHLREMDSAVPVVILSGYASMLALTPESTGANEVISKGPREHHDLIDTVLKLVPEAAHQRGKPPASEYGSSTARRPLHRRRRTG